jgi:hypothetical protein
MEKKTKGMNHMKILSPPCMIMIIAIILLVTSCNFPPQIPEQEAGITDPTVTTKLKPTSTQPNLESYTSELYSLNYPKGYTITLPIPGFPVLTIGKAPNQRMEIFQMKDFGDRPFGFTGEETQEDIDGYVPKEKLIVGSGEKQYDIWLFYSENDDQTKEELNSIVDSMVIKGE